MGVLTSHQQESRGPSPVYRVKAMVTLGIK